MSTKLNNPTTQFPLHMLTLTVLLSLFGFILIAWSMNSQGTKLAKAEKLSGNILLLKSEILHLDEILTMSCWVAVSTGNQEWVNRYHKFEPILDEKLKILISLVPEHLSQTVKQTQQANHDLIVLESKAFEQIKAQNLKKARSYLNHKQYNILKQDYRNGMNTLTKEIKKILNEKIRAFETTYRRLGVITVIVLIFLAVAWLIVLWSVHHWKRIILNAYQNAERAEKRLQTTLKMTQVGIFSSSSPYQTFQISPRTCELFGVEDHKELIYNDLLVKVDQHHRKRLLKHFKQHLTSKSSLLIREEFMIKDQNQERWLSIHGSFDYLNQHSTLFGWVRDITNTRKKTDLLQQDNKMLLQKVVDRTQESQKKQNQIQELLHSLLKAEKQERYRLSRLVHDELQQILVAARMQAAMARDMTNLTHKTLHDLIQYIDEAITSARDLTTRLSLLHNLDQDLMGMLYTLCTQMKRRYSFRVNIICEYDLSQLRPEILLLSYSMIHELLFNVVKHGQTDRADVHLDKINNDLRINVKDEGIGFDLDQFQKEHKNLGLEYGLGLSGMTHRVAMVDGTLTVDSLPDCGCKVEIYLPQVFLLEEENSLPYTSENSPISDNDTSLLTVSVPFSSDQQYTVLIADDNQALRTSLQTLIDQNPYFCVIDQSGNGPDTVSKAFSKIPDLILMDYSMPIFNGAQACLQIKSKLESVKIIGFSSFDTPEVVKEMIEAGAISVLTKSGEPADLIVEMLRICRL